MRLCLLLLLFAWGFYTIGSMRVLLQSLLLLFPLLLSFMAGKSSFFLHSPIIGFLIIVYVVSFLLQQKGKQISLGGPLGMFILNTIILLFVFSTGGLSSGFFLLYFVVFALVSFLNHIQ